MTDPIKAKIIELVPEIEEVVHDPDLSRYGSIGRTYVQRPITLADVLRSISKSRGGIGAEVIAVDQDGNFQEQIGAGEFHCSMWVWNLTIDYDGQTQEVKTFIGSLLGV